MCWRRRAWMPIAAMWPCHDTAMAWSCIMAATILPIRTGSPELCRVTGPRTWPRITGSAPRPEREAPERKVVEDPEAALRQARTKALVRHARAVDTIFDMQERGGKASPEQVKELQEARKVFEEVRPYGSHDAEAAYKKNPELAHEAAGGRVNRAIRALQLETELRLHPGRRADR